MSLVHDWVNRKWRYYHLPNNKPLSLKIRQQPNKIPRIKEDDDWLRESVSCTILGERDSFLVLGKSYKHPLHQVTTYTHILYSRLICYSRTIPLHLQPQCCWRSKGYDSESHTLQSPSLMIPGNLVLLLIILTDLSVGLFPQKTLETLYKSCVEPAR